ncbi:hypothetical protein ABIE62_002371 [Porphyrobacter sp. MBR-155]
MHRHNATLALSRHQTAILLGSRYQCGKLCHVFDAALMILIKGVAKAA